MENPNPDTTLIKLPLQDLLTLIAHYSSGQVPTNTEAINFGPSSVLKGWWGIESRVSQEDMDRIGAAEFTKDTYFYHFRYQGGRLLNFANKHEEPEWRKKDEDAL